MINWNWDGTPPQRHTWIAYYHKWSNVIRWLGWDGHRWHLLMEVDKDRYLEEARD